MSKRANGEGCVFQDATRGWSVAITIDGRRVVRKAPVQTRTGADQLLRKLLADRDDGGLVRGSMTLEKYVPEWLEALALRGVRPRSLEAYEDKVRKHLLPTLGKTKLDKLTTRQVERVYAAKLAEGLAPKSIDLLHTAFNGILKHAKRRGIITRNVLELVERPKVPKFEARPLTIEEAQRLLVAVQGHRDGAFWTFLVGTGLPVRGSGRAHVGVGGSRGRCRVDPAGGRADSEERKNAHGAGADENGRQRTHVADSPLGDRGTPVSTQESR